MHLSEQQFLPQLLVGPEEAEKTAREKKVGEGKQEADARTAELTLEELFCRSICISAVVSGLQKWT